MKIEPKMAIACRSEVEIAVALQMLEKADICWITGSKATENGGVGDLSECRLYVYPPTPNRHKAYLMYDNDPDNFEDDEEDEIEWNYVEAIDIFRNQIISERRKHVTST